MEEVLEYLNRIRQVVNSPNCSVQDLIEIIDGEPVPDYMLSNKWEGIWLNIGSNEEGIYSLTFIQYFQRSLRKLIFDIEGKLYKVGVLDTQDLTETINKLIVFTDLLISKNVSTPHQNDELQSLISLDLQRLRKMLLEFGLLFTPNGKNNFSSEKIKWNVGVSSIGQFFKDLLLVETSSGKRVFENQNRAEIIRLILNNFVDKNGNPFKESSLRSFIHENPKNEPTKDLIIPNFSALKNEL